MPCSSEVPIRPEMRVPRNKSLGIRGRMAECLGDVHHPPRTILIANWPASIGDRAVPGH